MQLLIKSQLLKSEIFTMALLSYLLWSISIENEPCFKYPTLDVLSARGPGLQFVKTWQKQADLFKLLGFEKRTVKNVSNWNCSFKKC